MDIRCISGLSHVWLNPVLSQIQVDVIFPLVNEETKVLTLILTNVGEWIIFGTLRQFNVAKWNIMFFFLREIIMLFFHSHFLSWLLFHRFNKRRVYEIDGNSILTVGFPVAKVVSSSNLTVCHWNRPISCIYLLKMVIFHSKLLVYQRVRYHPKKCDQTNHCRHINGYHGDFDRISI